MDRVLVACVLVVCVASRAHAVGPLVPVIDSEWWNIAGNPDLGEYTRPKQQPVDFGIWQAADGAWQLWSCIRKTGCGGQTRLFHRWEGQTLTDPDWTPMGIAMEAQPDFGETPGGLQAPHVVRWKQRYWMAYGDWVNICFATSEDGKHFTRCVRPNGNTGAFSEGQNWHTRDPMLLFTDGLWYAYYVAGHDGKGYDYARTSPDLQAWSHASVVAYGGLTGNTQLSCQCPFAAEIEPGHYYFLRTHNTSPGAHQSSVHYSRNPLNFGIDDDSTFVSTLPVAAPEILRHHGEYYIAAMSQHIDAIRMARLKWLRVSDFAQPIFDLDDEKVRQAWTVREGAPDNLFTTSTRTDFLPPMNHFIGTAEQRDGSADDALIAQAQSPPFALRDDYYLLWVSGGADRDGLYVALVDAQSGEELLRVSGHNSNRFRPVAVAAAAWRGRDVRIHIVDNARGRWGHINFGGLFRL